MADVVADFVRGVGGDEQLLVGGGDQAVVFEAVVYPLEQRCPVLAVDLFAIVSEGLTFCLYAGPRAVSRETIPALVAPHDASGIALKVKTHVSVMAPAGRSSTPTFQYKRIK